MKQAILFIAGLVILASCTIGGFWKPTESPGSRKPPEKIITEGKVVYVSSGLITDTTELLFNENYIVIKSIMNNNRTQVMKFDKRTKEALRLVQDWSGEGRDLYFTYELQNEDYPVGLFAFRYDIEAYTNSFEDKTLLGYECRHALEPIDRSSFIREAWYTDEIQPGLWPPASQLINNHLPLMYHTTGYGREYWIEAISVSEEEIPGNEFEHVVPDPFFFKTPQGYFTTNKESRDQFVETALPSFAYPHYNGNRMSTIEYFENKLGEFGRDEPIAYIRISFVVNKDGAVSNIVAECVVRIEDEPLERLMAEKAVQVFRDAGGWTPARVRGSGVNSKVEFVYSH
jgi:hypothetical protein